MSTDQEFNQIKRSVSEFEPDPDAVAVMDDEEIIKADPESRDAAIARIRQFKSIEDRKLEAGMVKRLVPLPSGNGYKEVWVMP